MPDAHYKVITDINGMRGVITSDHLDSGQEQVVVVLPDDAKVLVQRAELVLRDNGTYFFPRSLNSKLAPNSVVIPVIEEQVKMNKRQVETGRVRITTRTHEDQHIIHDIALHEEADVQRVPINQPVDSLLDIRYEGDTLVIPVVEEVLVVEKRLVLKEEVRITLRKTQTTVEQPVTLRKQEVIVDRLPIDDAQSEA